MNLLHIARVTLRPYDITGPCIDEFRCNDQSIPGDLDRARQAVPDAKQSSDFARVHVVTPETEGGASRNDKQPA